MNGRKRVLVTDMSGLIDRPGSGIKTGELP